MKRLFFAGFIALLLCVSAVGGVSAGKQGDTSITLHVNETIKQGTEGWTGITVKPSGDASAYVAAKYVGKNDMRYTGLKVTPPGKTANFDVGKDAWYGWYYNTVHVTVVP
ncbi:MAG: hypothetical protein LBD03_07655 [Methanobrevibacter sp.]|nr:hypothetical protein [Candidatus Methanovirga procula]